MLVNIDFYQLSDGILLYAVGWLKPASKHLNSDGYHFKADLDEAAKIDRRAINETEIDRLQC